MPMRIYDNPIEIPKVFKYVKGERISQICAIDEIGRTYILWWQPYARVMSEHNIEIYRNLTFNEIINNNVLTSCRNAEYASHIKAALEQLANT